jgi:CRISPR/Cas system-associated exonuclease Cas4 (RecB family)
MAYSSYKPKLYQSDSSEPFKVSRSKIDLFMECPRCFYLDKKLGISRPSMPGFSLNSAVDHLLKKEFDLLRSKKESHELMKKYHIDAVPFQHPDLEVWRENFTGVQFHHKPTNLLIFGAVDDIWVNPQGQLIVVDYKSTSTEKEISLEDQYKQGYKKQLEIYQWLLAQNGFEVSETGYFVFANASKSRPQFDGKLEFEMSIISYTGTTNWIEPVVLDIKSCLDSPELPKNSPDCEYCVYSRGRLQAVSKFVKPS